MKIWGSLALVLVLAVGACWAQGNKMDEDKIVSMEKQLWDAWKDHKGEVFKQMLPAESVNVGTSGVQGTDQIVADISKSDCDISSYSLANEKITWIDKNTALLTYKADQDATCGGQKIPTSVWASSIWVKRGGKWQALFHQETALQEAMQAVQPSSQ